MCNMSNLELWRENRLSLNLPKGSFLLCLRVGVVGVVASFRITILSMFAGGHHQVGYYLWTGTFNHNISYCMAYTLPMTAYSFP